MLIRLTIPAIALLYATGCCCCGGGGGGSSSSSSSSWTDALEERAAEAITEKVIEAATDIDDLEIDQKTGTISMKTEEGTMVLNGDDDGATLDFTGADGTKVEFTAGTDGEVPAGFPLAVPKGAEIAFANSSKDGNGTTYMLMMQHAGGSQDAIEAHWQAELGKRGAVTRHEITEGKNKIVSLVVPSEQGTIAAISLTDGELASTITVKVPN
ncbi:MAG: hypothetical protein KC912_11950 [Proteobacteria bacterium]|nr:hypothetical protein [Pseudomonadota bacterium]